MELQALTALIVKSFLPGSQASFDKFSTNCAPARANDFKCLAMANSEQEQAPSSDFRMR